MTTYNIYTDAQGRIQAIYANCDTGTPPVGATKTTQEGGTPPVLDPYYIPAPSTPTTPNVQDQINAIVAQLTPDQQDAINASLASASNQKTPSQKATP